MKDNQKILVDNLINKAKEAVLTTEEKSGVLFALLQEINKTPVPTPFWSFTFIRQFNYIPATLLAFLIIGSSISAFAQSALPGDILYSMKINVNESIESALALTDKQSAEVQAIQATRRLDEAEILATDGLLTVKQNDELKSSFSKKVKSLNVKLGKLSEKGESSSAEEVLNNFDTKVKNKVDKLSVVSKKSTTSPAKDIVTFIKDNHKEGDKNSKVRAMAASSDIETQSISSENEPPKAAMLSATSLEDDTIQSTTTATTTEDKNLLNVKVIWSWDDKGEEEGE